MDQEVRDVDEKREESIEFRAFMRGYKNDDAYVVLICLSINLKAGLGCVKGTRDGSKLLCWGIR